MSTNKKCTLFKRLGRSIEQEGNFCGQALLKTNIRTVSEFCFSTNKWGRIQSILITFNTFKKKTALQFSGIKTLLHWIVANNSYYFFLFFRNKMWRHDQNNYLVILYGRYVIKSLLSEACLNWTDYWSCNTCRYLGNSVFWLYFSSCN